MSDSMTVLLSGGMDAYANLYDVTIWIPKTGTSGGVYGGEEKAEYNVRALGFTPPELSVGEYTIAYKGVKLIRPNAKIVGEREFSIEYRHDANYTLFKELNTWKATVINPNAEGIITFGAFSKPVTDNPAMYGKVVVTAYKALTTSVTTPAAAAITWTFDQVICINVGSPAFTRAGNDATRITSKFMFLNYNCVNS